MTTKDNMGDLKLRNIHNGLITEIHNITKIHHYDDNFTEVLLGNNFRGPALIDWRVNKYGNIIDDKNNTIFYKKSNISQ